MADSLVAIVEYALARLLRCDKNNTMWAGLMGNLNLAPTCSVKNILTSCTVRLYDCTLVSTKHDVNNVDACVTMADICRGHVSWPCLARVLPARLWLSENVIAYLTIYCAYHGYVLH